MSAPPRGSAAGALSRLYPCGDPYVALAEARALLGVDNCKAVLLLRYAAVRGIAEAHTQLGLCYFFGVGVARVDKPLAVDCWDEAIALGDECARPMAADAFKELNLLHTDAHLWVSEALRPPRGAVLDEEARHLARLVRKEAKEQNVSRLKAPTFLQGTGLLAPLFIALSDVIHARIRKEAAAKEE